MRIVDSLSLSDLRKPLSARWVWLLAFLFALLVGKDVRGQDANMIYSDGSTPITIQITADANYEDSQWTGAIAGGASPGLMLYPVGTVPTRATTPPYGFTPAPSAGPGYPTQFGSYSAAPTTGPNPGDTAGTRTNASFGPVDSGMVATMQFAAPAQGFYYVFDLGIIAQASPGYGDLTNDASPIRSRWITIDSIKVVNPVTPGTIPNPPIPAVSVLCTPPATATKGAGDHLAFVFQRNPNSANFSQPLTVYYSLGGSEPSSDYGVSSPTSVTFAANSTTAYLNINPKNNGVYDGSGTVVVTLQPDQANPATYSLGILTTAQGVINSSDRPPAVTFTTPGVANPGGGNNWTLTVNAGQNYMPTIHAHDPDGNLQAAWIYKGTATPTGSTGVVQPFGSGYLSGYDGDLTSFTESIFLPGPVVYSAWACDTNGVYSQVGTLTVTVINYPPTDVFTTPGITPTGNNSWALTVPINTPVNVMAHLHDASGDLVETIIDSIYDDPVHSYNGTPSYRILEQSINGTDADVSVAQSWSVPGTYLFSSSAIDRAQQLSPTAHLAVTVIDRPPTFAWTTGGISQYGTDPHYQTVTIIPGQTIAISAHATDPDSDLDAILIDSTVDTPPGSAGFDYQGVSGGAGDASSNFTGGAPRDQWFSGRSMDLNQDYSDTFYLRVHVDAPPQVAWVGLGGPGQNIGPLTMSVGQTLPIIASYTDADGAGDNQLVYTWASTTADPSLGVFSTDNGPRAADTSNYQRTFGNGFAPTVPGTYYFYAQANDGLVSSSQIVLTVVVQNQPPTIAWSVPNAYPVPDQPGIWELDLKGAAAAPTIAATGVDPENRLAGVFINRGTGDPTNGQGTPFASSTSALAGAVMTPDEMRPPLSTTLDSAAWEPVNQDNYSWFSAGSTDQDGGHSQPIHLLVRVLNRAPSNAVWLSPSGVAPTNATDGVLTVYPNQPALSLSALSSDPEQKMGVTLLSKGYVTPVAGNAAGNELNAGYTADGSSATAAYAPGAETFDVVGDHWFSAIGMDQGQMYSGGTTPAASHLDIKVVNRPPSAGFAGAVSGAPIRRPLAIKAVGTDPDNAMLRVQSVVVSAPAGSGYAAGQVLGDTSVPATQQVYPSNMPTWETDAVLTPLAGGTYVVRSLAWDRHGGTAQADMTFSVVDQPPVFAWTQAVVHVLAGTPAQLPFTVADPDGDLNVATATGPGGYTQQLSFANLGSGSGSFMFPTTQAGTYIVTGAAYDLENLESTTQPTISVIVEAQDTAPVATFTSPLPGGLTSTVTHFVDDVVAVNALGTDVDGNLTALNVSLGGATWARSPQGGDVASLNVGSPFTVPPLGAEASHTYVFNAVATDAGTLPGGYITQPPLVSPAAVLNIVVPNRPPTVVWTVPASPAGLTQATPFVGYLLQPLQITASGNDRDGNLASVTISQVGAGNSILSQATSADGRTALASYAFTPTVPGLYEFAAQATDQANATSGPVDLWVLVQDYPSDTTGTIGALIVSPVASLTQVFSAGTLPIVVKGGVATLGRTTSLGGVGILPTTGPSQVVPVPGYLDGTMIPPFSPAILDLRTLTVAPAVDHADPATSNN